MKKYLAFDVGGTSIKYAVLDSNCVVLTNGKAPTRNNRDQTIIKTLLSVTTEMLDEFTLSGIGVSTAGRVGKYGEIVYAGPTVSDYQGTQIKASLEKESQLPVHVMNDVDAALMGEIFRGHHQRNQSIYCIALGTGIGGAFYVNGQRFDGAHNLGNAVGSLNYDPQTKKSFESHASTLAFQNQLAPFNVTVPEAFTLARQGNEKYQQLISKWCHVLGKQIAQICLLLDPDIFLIGGAVSQQGDYFINQIKNATNYYLPDGLDNVDIQATELQDKAQLYGAISPFFL
ncbi:ROK family protein [Limosilactobacillus caecicola]|uniref:ROK family protein n=1 Tax=Limosilactobacillus caecicola TaxID=2941332 RepID=UPI00203FCB8E|nr:ROK family protein [Limosilactobacillus caecicola]